MLSNIWVLSINIIHWEHPHCAYELDYLSQFHPNLVTDSDINSKNPALASTPWSCCTVPSNFMLLSRGKHFFQLNIFQKKNEVHRKQNLFFNTREKTGLLCKHKFLALQFWTRMGYLEHILKKYIMKKTMFWIKAHKEMCMWVCYGLIDSRKKWHLRERM